jgi:hypothetical protein
MRLIVVCAEGAFSEKHGFCWPNSERWCLEEGHYHVSSRKKLMYTVDVGESDPRFGKMLLEQFGGAMSLPLPCNTLFRASIATIQV